MSENNTNSTALIQRHLNAAAETFQQPINAGLRNYVASLQEILADLDLSNPSHLINPLPEPAHPTTDSIGASEDDPPYFQIG